MAYEKSIMVRGIPLLGICLIFCSVYFVSKPFFIDNAATIILSAYIFACAIGALLGIIYLKPMLCPFPNKLYIPTGFKNTIIGLILISLIGVFKSDIDRYAVWHYLSIEDLGYYGACVTIYLALRYFPQSFGSIFLVTFSKMIKNENYGEIKLFYQKTFRNLNLLVISATLFISSFSYHILLIYGDNYSQYYIILLLLSIRSIITVPSLLNSPLILSGQNVNFRIFYDCLELFISGLFIIMFVRLYGLLGVALARILTGFFMETLGIFYVKKKMAIFVPYRFFITIVIQLLNCYCVYLFPQSFFLSSVIFVSSLILLFLLRVTTFQEVLQLINSIKKNRKNN